MNAAEKTLREDICLWGESLFARGLTAGSSGNLSARLEDGFLVTPTNSCLGFLDPARLTKLDMLGRVLSGDAPTKELSLHLSFYRARPQAGGIVHLHSPYAAAVSCLAGLNEADAIPALTPYVIMKVGRVPLVPYTNPGSEEVVRHIEQLGGRHAALLLANHGPVVSAATFVDAVFCAEELEAAAQLQFLLAGRATQHIPAASQEALRRKWSN